MVAGSIPGGDIFSCLIVFWFFFFVFRSLQLGGALANEIKHDHSAVVIVVIDRRYD